MFKQSVMSTGELGSALRRAETTLRHSVREVERRESNAADWMQRFVTREVQRRVAARDATRWETGSDSLTREQLARRRIRSILARGTLASAAAALGASSAGVLSVLSEGAAVPGALPLGLFSVVGEMLYTTALQIELVVDLASIYGVPFRASNVSEVSTLLGLALGVKLEGDPGSSDGPAGPGGSKAPRVQPQMQSPDFSRRLGMTVIQQSVLRNILPIVGVAVSATWSNMLLRRFARQVHAIVRQRRAIVDGFSGLQLPDPVSARVVLDGAWLLATADGELGHQEALALATLIDALGLPERVDVNEASFNDDQEGWFVRVRELDEDARGVLVKVLSLVAGADGDFNTGERRFLERLGTTLGREIDLGAIERTVARLRVGQIPFEQRPSAAVADAALAEGVPAPA
jgi:tellurite resistance protein